MYGQSVRQGKKGRGCHDQVPVSQAQKDDDRCRLYKLDNKGGDFGLQSSVLNEAPAIITRFFLSRRFCGMARNWFAHRNACVARSFRTVNASTITTCLGVLEVPRRGKFLFRKAAKKPPRSIQVQADAMSGTCISPALPACSAVFVTSSAHTDIPSWFIRWCPCYRPT